MDENGKDRDFTGIFGDVNEDVHEPYLICTEHTKETWDAYLEEHPEMSTRPNDPTASTDDEE